MPQEEKQFRKYALMAVSSECNQKCSFCFEGGFQYDIPPKKQLLEMIDAIAERGFERIVFIGGEVTIVKGVEDLIAHITRRGMDARITTNGLALADPAFLSALAAAGLRHIEFSFHSHIKEDAAALSGRADTNEKQIRALENLRELTAASQRPVTINTNTVITTTNAPYLPEMTTYLERFGCVATYSFKAPTIEGRAAKNPGIVPRFSDASASLQKVFAALSRDENRLIIDSFPLCSLPPELLPCTVSFKDMDAILEGFNFGTRAENDRFDMFGGAKLLPACARCSLATICGGFPSAYIEMFGGEEANPLPSLFALPPRIASLAAQCLARRGRKDTFHAQCPGNTPSPLADWAAKQAATARYAGFRKINIDLSRLESPGPELPNIIRAVLSAGLAPVITSRAFHFSDERVVQAFSEFKHAVETELIFINADPAASGRSSADPLFLKDCSGVMRLARVGAPPLIVAPVFDANAREMKKIARLAQELGAGGIAFLFAPQNHSAMLEFKERRPQSPGENIISNIRRAVETAMRNPGFATELRGFPFEAFPDWHYLYKAPYHED